MIEISSFSGIGTRKNQQDRFGIYQSGQELVHDCTCQNNNGVLAFVSDGIGGTSDGAVASGFMQEIVRNHAKLQEDVSTGKQLLLEIIDEGCARVKQFHYQNPEITTGATFVGVYFQENSFDFCSVGDSRIYLYRAGKLLQINREHVYLRNLLLNASRGVCSWNEAFENEEAKCLTQYIGMEQICSPDYSLHPVEIMNGDIILLMSDGIFGVLDICFMEEILKQGNLSEVTILLEEEIQKKNLQGQDNYTCVLLKIVE